MFWITYVTTALGFFSTAYTLIFLSAFWAALSAARTRGPLPAPTTITTLKQQWIWIVFCFVIIKILLNLYKFGKFFLFIFSSTYHVNNTKIGIERENFYRQKAQINIRKHNLCLSSGDFSIPIFVLSLLQYFSSHVVHITNNFKYQILKQQYNDYNQDYVMQVFNVYKNRFCISQVTSQMKF